LFDHIVPVFEKTQGDFFPVTNTIYQKKRLVLTRDFRAEGSAESEANLNKVSEIERKLPRAKVRTKLNVFSDNWYNSRVKQVTAHKGGRKCSDQGAAKSGNLMQAKTQLLN